MQQLVRVCIYHIAQLRLIFRSVRGSSPRVVFASHMLIVIFLDCFIVHIFAEATSPEYRTTI